MAKIKVIQLKTKIKSEDATLGKYENPKFHYFHVHVDNKNIMPYAYPELLDYNSAQFYRHNASQYNEDSAIDFINTNFVYYHKYHQYYAFAPGPAIDDNHWKYLGPYTVTMRGSYQLSRLSIPAKYTLGAKPAKKTCVWCENIGEFYDASTCWSFEFEYAGGKLEDFLKYTNNYANHLYLNCGTVSGSIKTISTKLPNLQQLFLQYLDGVYGNVDDLFLPRLKKIYINGSENITGRLESFVEKEQDNTITIEFLTNNTITLNKKNFTTNKLEISIITMSQPDGSHYFEASIYKIINGYRSLIAECDDLHGSIRWNYYNDFQ